VGGAYRLHTGQAIGVLAGAVGAGSQAAGTGLTLIAGSDNTELQAQAGTLQIAARDDVNIQSQSAHIDWAAAKKITLATAGGASIVIEGGNITVACPGTITVKASAKRFAGPTNMGYEMNAMQGPSSFDEEIRVVWPVGGKPVANQAFEVMRADGSRVRGKTDANGNTGLQKSDFPEDLQLRLLGD
jgi:type VI secretion system secreted protein VgrG